MTPPSDNQFSLPTIPEESTEANTDTSIFGSTVPIDPNLSLEQQGFFQQAFREAPSYQLPAHQQFQPQEQLQRQPQFQPSQGPIDASRIVSLPSVDELLIYAEASPDLERINNVLIPARQRKRDLELTIKVSNDMGNIVSKQFTAHSCEQFARYQERTYFELLSLIARTGAGLSDLQLFREDALALRDSLVAGLTDDLHRRVNDVWNLINSMKKCGLTQLASRIQVRLDNFLRGSKRITKRKEQPWRFDSGSLT